MTDNPDDICVSCIHLVSRDLAWFCPIRGEGIDHPRYFHCHQWISADEEEKPHMSTFMDELKAVLDDDFNFLVDKNIQYGDSALDPLRVFSQACTKEQIFVRIDDKLSRIKRGDAKIEDTFKDLRGYLNLLEVFERREKAKGEKQ